MNKLNFMSGLGICLAFLTAGCTATKFDSVKGVTSEKSAAGGEYGGSVSQLCQTSLGARGFTQVSGRWQKRISRSCGYTGIGYVEVDLTYQPPSVGHCPTLAEVEQAINGQQHGKNVPPDMREQGLRQLAGEGAGAEWQTTEVSRHCATASRCGGARSPESALGRLAWLKKCEAQVPAFKAFLDGLRKIEDCSNPGVAERMDPACMFTHGQASYFPVVKLNGSATDNAPAPSVSGQSPARIDDLALPNIQNQIAAACPPAAAVAPIDTVCTAGCYRGDQRLLISPEGKYSGIQSAKEAGVKSIAVLARSSTLENPRYTRAPVASFTATIEDSNEVLLSFETASGAKLVITTNHPLVDAQGVMREATFFKAGDDLLNADGRRDKIVSITQQTFFGKVYNVAPVSPAPEDNLVVSEGIINGSHNYQTNLRSLINRQVLRGNLAEGI